eukprot:9496102-Pyramimonas_sp.AAC.2
MSPVELMTEAVLSGLAGWYSAYPAAAVGRQLRPTTPALAHAAYTACLAENTSYSPTRPSSVPNASRPSTKGCHATAVTLDCSPRQSSAGTCGGGREGGRRQVGRRSKGGSEGGQKQGRNEKVLSRARHGH